MALEIVCDGFNPVLLTKQQVKEIIELFFNGTDTKFCVMTGSGKASSRSARGVHIYNLLGGYHEIYLNTPLIINHYSRRLPMGGNRVAVSVQHAAALVLCHEVQHANQTLKHRSEHEFYKGKYRARACEREAREFADKNYDMLAAFVGKQIVKHRSGDYVPCDMGRLIESLKEAGTVTFDDVREGLRLTDSNNAKSFEVLVSSLREAGVRVVKHT